MKCGYHEGWRIDETETQLGTLTVGRDALLRLTTSKNICRRWVNAAFPDRVGGCFHVYVFAPLIGSVVVGLFLLG